MRIKVFAKVCLAAILFSVTAVCGQDALAKKKVVDSKTTYAKDVLQPYVDSGQLPGAISVFYKDGIQETCCIGYADVASKRKIKMNSAFMQCSQTKGFCGVTIAKLVEEGKLSLDDPVSKYLPEFEELWVRVEKTDSSWVMKKAKNVLTVRMVLNHTGGFPFEISAKRGDVRGGGWSGGAPIRQVASIAAASPLRFEPGTDIRYSNTGIDIGAAIVEVITGMKWEQYLKKEVLDPLGMKSTWFWPTDKQISNKIELYEYKENAPAVWREEMGNQQRPYNDSHVFASAGAGLWTTAEDQLKFYKMLMNLGVGENGVRILKEETVKSILAVTTRPEEMAGYSLGLTAPKVDSEDAWFGHGGAWGTKCSVNWHKKELRLWVVQRAGGPQPWVDEIKKAANEFFEHPLGRSDVDAYTGRTQ
ncbi:MAG: beta-lactamase family protein [Bacteroidales bacterium]|nr:beta-lactamase family protein [Bacteroidales bacterium]